MKKLVRRARCALAAAALCAAAAVLSLALRPPGWRLCAAAALGAGLLAALALSATSGELKTARLIVENQIVRIQPAVLGAPAGGTGPRPHPMESVEVFVSCFGILLGSRVILFNRDGIRLRAVEIGRDCLSLDYGRGADVRRIRLLHPRPDGAALDDVVEKFRYETGVTPTIPR